MTLVERLCAATEGSRELDAEIAKALGLIPQSADKVRGDYESSNWMYSTPEYRAWDKRQSKHFSAHGNFDDNDIAPELGPGYIRPYTASLDAAMTLVPSGWTRDVDATAPECGIDVTLHAPGKPARIQTGTHGTEPIATCIAALKARESA